jgi:hypothetical protein
MSSLCRLDCKRASFIVIAHGELMWLLVSYILRVTISYAYRGQVGDRKMWQGPCRNWGAYVLFKGSGLPVSYFSVKDMAVNMQSLNSMCLKLFFWNPLQGKQQYCVDQIYVIAPQSSVVTDLINYINSLLYLTKILYCFF